MIETVNGLFKGTLISQNWSNDFYGAITTLKTTEIFVSNYNPFEKPSCNVRTREWETYANDVIFFSVSLAYVDFQVR